MKELITFVLEMFPGKYPAVLKKVPVFFVWTENLACLSGPDRLHRGRDNHHSFYTEDQHAQHPLIVEHNNAFVGRMRSGTTTQAAVC